MADLKYRKLALEGEDSALYFELFRKVYGNTAPLENRWQWEYVGHPLREELIIYAVQDGPDLAAVTTRLPFDLKVGDRIVRCYFSVDSMALSSYRRQGLMRSLYELAMREMPLLYSKGAVPGMYNLLLKLGYQPITPNTYLVNYLAPFKLLFARVAGRPPAVRSSAKAFQAGADMLAVDRFGAEFDSFWERSAKGMEGIVVKNAAYMNWRYRDIPHKKYAAYYGIQAGKITSLVVLGRNGSIGKIVDILWDGECPGEPDRALRFALKYFRHAGCFKVLCWGTQRKLREALGARRFFDRKETPRFSTYSASLPMAQFTRGEDFHFVDGDGDYDFLG
ncbi:MAG: GNAT family N-acetyltransferase [Desulfatitalea sp.]